MCVGHHDVRDPVAVDVPDGEAVRVAAAIRDRIEVLVVQRSTRLVQVDTDLAPPVVHDHHVVGAIEIEVGQVQAAGMSWLVKLIGPKSVPSNPWNSPM